MVSPDNIAQLRQMRDNGEISEEEYEALRRHVLWGAPLPDLSPSDEPDAPDASAEPAATDPPAEPATGRSPGPPGPLPTPPLGPASGAQPAISPLPAEPYQPPHPSEPGDLPRSEELWSGESWWSPEQAAWAGQPAPAGPQQTRRRGGQRGRTALLVPLGVAVLLIGAGVWWLVIRSTGVPPSKYAQTVCAKVQSWHDDVTAESGELQQALSANSDPSAAQANLGSFFDQMASRTDTLQHDVDAIGPPGISDGKGYQADLDRTLSDTTSALRGAANQSRGLDIHDRAGFSIAVQALQAQVNQTISGVTDSLASTSTPAELRTAYSNAGNCAPFTG